MCHCLRRNRLFCNHAATSLLHFLKTIVLLVMLKSLKIENFRGFQSFEFQQLGRINLLVGENSSGKTSALEAVELLSSRANLEIFQIIHDIVRSRGEYFWSGEDDDDRELDIRQLFHNREMKLGSSFSITAESQIGKEKLNASIDLTSNSNSPFEEAQLTFRWLSDVKEQQTYSTLTSNSGFPTSSTIIRLREEPNKSVVKTQLIRSSSLTAKKMIDLFNQIVLTPEENLVYEALKIIEPRIERIAIKTTKFMYSSDARGGIAAGLSDAEYPVSLGSLGDGMWRMLGLVVALINVRGGMLLIDEIDTGLHFSTMTKMWNLVWNTAKSLDVQIFATTHSRDCWESLAELIEAEGIAEDEIAIHRIEKGKSKSVLFDAEQVVIAAERGIEVR